MNDAINLAGADYVFEFVVIADVSFDKWDLDVVLCAQINDAGFEALVERVLDDD